MKELKDVKVDTLLLDIILVVGLTAVGICFILAMTKHLELIEYLVGRR